MTHNHSDFYRYLAEGNDAVGYGVAGTGKTYITLYHALNQLRNQYIQKIIIIRSAVATRDLGFLPGTEQEKLAVYESPYMKIINDLLDRGDGYEILKKRGELEFLSSSFLRGLTFDNSIIVVDECQNLTFHELDTIYTRTGENTQVCFIGDLEQLDEGVGKTGSGFNSLVKLASELGSFGLVKFGFNDIVRSEKVKNWIIRKSELGIR